MAKVSQEQAEKEITSWLDAKKISQTKREAKKDAVEALVNAMIDGELILNAADMTFQQSLKFPLRGDKDAGLAKLTYKSRLSTQQMQACLKGAKLGDGIGVIISVIACLTGELDQSIKLLDTEDLSIGQSIATFFLP